MLLLYDYFMWLATIEYDDAKQETTAEVLA
jgi:hypothetical protein